MNHLPPSSEVSAQSPYVHLHGLFGLRENEESTCQPRGCRGAVVLGPHILSGPRFEGSTAGPLPSLRPEALCLWFLLRGTYWTRPSRGPPPRSLQGQGWLGQGGTPTPASAPAPSWPPCRLTSPSLLKRNQSLKRGWKCQRGNFFLCVVILRGPPGIAAGTSPDTKLGLRVSGALRRCPCPWAWLWPPAGLLPSPPRSVPRLSFPLRPSCGRCPG